MKAPRASQQPSGSFDFKLAQLVLLAGGSLYARVPIFLQVGGVPVIWLSSDAQDRQMLNLDLRDSSGTLLLSMRDNEWDVVGDIADLECPPAANRLLLRSVSKDVGLDVRFDRLTRAKLATLVAEQLGRGNDSMDKHLAKEVQDARARGLPQSWIDQLELLRKNAADRAHGAGGATRRLELICSEWAGDEFIVCELQAKLPYPRAIHLTETRTTAARLTIAGAAVTGARVAINLS